MVVYIINLLSVFFWHILTQMTRLKDREKIFIGIITLQLFILSAFRDFSVGADTYNYINRFTIIANTSWNNIPNLPEVLDFELGFIILNKLFSLLTTSPRIYLLSINLIILLGVAKFIYNNSKIYWLSYFLFIGMGFWGDSLNILRQFLAVVILLNSIEDIKNNRLVTFIVRVLIASSFHNSALFFIIIYPISKMRINKKYYFSFVVSTIFVYLFSGRILNFLLLNFSYGNLSRSLGMGSGSGMLILLIGILFLTLLFKKDFLSKIKNPQVYIHILTVAILLNILALEFGIIGRMMIYFTSFNIILVPNVIFSIYSEEYTFFSKYFFIIVVSYYYIFRVLVIDASNVVPYIFLN